MSKHPLWQHGYIQPDATIRRRAATDTLHIDAILCCNPPPGPYHRGAGHMKLPFDWSGAVVTESLA